MVVFGTRPEAIKMAPVIKAFRARPGVQTLVAVTAQHRQMLDQVLELFGIVPDDDLDLMRTNQDLPDLFSRILIGLSEVISRRKPDLVLVHGDTSTTLAAAMAAFYARVPVGHVEAGLRTGNMEAPWPEEMNRRLVTPLAQLHFAPTIGARANLLAEGVEEARIHVTGNTVVDALLQSVARIQGDQGLSAQLDSTLPSFAPSRRLVLVTGHRRESFGEGFENICRALGGIAELDDVEVVYPVHLNPNVQEPVQRLLGDRPNVHLIAPLDYLPFVQLMRRADLIITDSGGIQEEAPSLGKPVLVMRDVSERPEAVSAGTARLVGTDPDRIHDAALELLGSTNKYAAMANARNPYGDGMAAIRIVEHIEAGWTAGAPSAAPTGIN
ncbi:non-hydrolyzing UDP-N-acetylglucosamine 2-epimerase [Luteimonas qiangzhengi]|uniref:non-hydrolyzing UDP-N-acetylglucosamine 2-epimerase n=1 Tax=Luteimonas sp. MJ146 TaxID=3129240 RepID=UPI0031BA741B